MLEASVVKFNGLLEQQEAVLGEVYRKYSIVEEHYVGEKAAVEEAQNFCSVEAYQAKVWYDQTIDAQDRFVVERQELSEANAFSEQFSQESNSYIETLAGEIESLHSRLALA